MKNKRLKKRLCQLYGSKCWLSGVYMPINDLTLHHIFPVRAKKKNKLKNGALLSNLMHQIFNYIEMVDPLKANELNWYFYKYKGNYPPAVVERIQTIVFEYVTINDSKMVRIRKK